MSYPSRIQLGLGLQIANGWPKRGGAVNWYNASGVIQCGVVIECNDEVIPCL